MGFKKDYINNVLHSVIQSEFYGVRDDIHVRKVLEKIMSIPDVSKAVFLAGKTDGLEVLFKYLLYVSDKIDKSQITIFNIRDNFEYDLQNLKRICGEIKNYRKSLSNTEPVAGEQAVTITETEQINETTEPGERQIPEAAGVEESGDEVVQEIVSDETAETVEEAHDTFAEETEEPIKQPDFTLIENKEEDTIDEEVFALTDITRSLEIEESASAPEPETDENEEAEVVSDEEIIKEAIALEDVREDVNESSDYEEEILPPAVTTEILNQEEEPQEEEDFEFEIKKERTGVESEKETEVVIRDDTATSEAYYNFENRFFEEVKILEKLFSRTRNECKKKELKKLSERTLQSFTEIIEISSELANLTRQLQFDLTADIFLTINLFFTKAINTPSLINPDRIDLLNSALMLVKSLIKDEDYLGYDDVVNKIEVLKEDIKKPAEQQEIKPAAVEEAEVKKTEEAVAENVPVKIEAEQKHVGYESADQEEGEQKIAEQKPMEIPAAEDEIVEIKKSAAEEPILKREPQKTPGDSDTSLFKMKYLVKEIEKSFLKLGNIQGEYDKFEVLEVVDEVNDLLKMLAKISASVRNTDVLKLSEVTYVFLKYLKDYKMDLLDSEIQQIIRYIIFTYKMLLTNRKPEDFEILVQYLNNPVKIFADT
jgi:hypothetical protein